MKPFEEELAEAFEATEKKIKHEEDIVEAYKKLLKEQGFVDHAEFLSKYPLEVLSQELLRELRKTAMIFRLSK